MLNFRQFETGPDPFGRAWQVCFKWLQTAIALRHSDTVDARFVLQRDGERLEKTIALPHPVLRELARARGRELTDPWCSRLAALHLRHIVATGEDWENEPATPSAVQLGGYAAAIETAEQEEIRRRAGVVRA